MRGDVRAIRNRYLDLIVEIREGDDGRLTGLRADMLDAAADEIAAARRIIFAPESS